MGTPEEQLLKNVKNIYISPMFGAVRAWQRAVTTAQDMYSMF